MTENGRSSMPRCFATPEGRFVSIKTMSRALRMIRRDPDAEYPGWEWFPVSGHSILKSFRAGMHDRINQRGSRTVQNGA